MKAEITNSNLKSWEALNKALRNSDEAACNALLEDEVKGRNRPTFKLRIHSRLNKVRADRERVELLKTLL